jgi:hypothetical protein
VFVREGEDLTEMAQFHVGCNSAYSQKLWQNRGKNASFLEIAHRQPRLPIA